MKTELKRYQKSQLKCWWISLSVLSVVGVGSLGTAIFLFPSVVLVCVGGCTLALVAILAPLVATEPHHMRDWNQFGEWLNGPFEEWLKAPSKSCCRRPDGKSVWPRG